MVDERRGSTNSLSPHEFREAQALAGLTLYLQLRGGIADPARFLRDARYLNFPIKGDYVQRDPTNISWGGYHLDSSKEPQLLIPSRGLAIVTLPTEFKFMEILLNSAAAGEITLTSNIKRDMGISTDGVQQYAKRLRMKFGSLNRSLLSTVKGFEYKLNPAEPII